MNDTAFIAALESGSLPKQLMNHAAHLRLALIYRGEPEKAREVLLKYVDKVGAHVKYNETLTWFWLKAVNAHEGDLAALLRTPLADTNLPMRHWSPELLWSDAARQLDCLAVQRLPLEQRCGDAVQSGLVLHQEQLGPGVLLGDDLADLGVDLDRRGLGEVARPLRELAAEEHLALLLAEGQRP